MNVMIIVIFLVSIAAFAVSLISLRAVRTLHRRLSETHNDLQRVENRVHDLTHQSANCAQELGTITELYQQLRVLNYMILNADLKDDISRIEQDTNIDKTMHRLLKRLKQNVDETEIIRKKICDR